MAKLFNEDGSINREELDKLTNELNETQVLREGQINRRDIRINEINTEMDAYNEQLDVILDNLNSPTLIPGSITRDTLLLSMRAIQDKLVELAEEREKLSNKYNI